MNPFVRLIALAGLVLTAACTPTLKSDVSRFHKLQPPAGEAIFVMPKDEALTGSLEFERYAQLVRDRLTGLGYKTAASKDAAQLLVRIDYRVSDPNERVRTRPGAPNPYAYYRFRAGFYDPYWIGSGFDTPEVYSTTVYARYLDMDIVTNAEKPESLFEGHAESIGTNNSLPEIMPYLVQAMFTNFPGENGVTKRVIIDLPK